MKQLDKKVYRKIAETFILMACDNTGQPVKAKSLDRVMEDILGSNDFFHRLCKIRTDHELRVIFNGADIMAIVSIVENERQINTLYSMLELDRDMYSLKRKIKRFTKKGKKCKNLRERYQKLEKIYRKAVKAFKELLGVRDFKKDGKPSKKYSDIISFTKRHSDSYGIYDDIFGFDMDDDDDDDDPVFTGYNGYYHDRQGRPVHDLVFREPQTNPITLFGRDDDEEDEEEYEDDDDMFDIKLAIEEINDRNQKILSAIGSMIANNGGMLSVPAHTGEVIQADQFSFVEDDDMEDYSARLERVEDAIVDILDLLRGNKTDSTESVEEGPRPAYDPYEEGRKAMDLLLHGDEEAGPAPVDPDTMQATVIYEETSSHVVEEKDYKSMETKALIDENNSQT